MNISFLIKPVIKILTLLKCMFYFTPQSLDSSLCLFFKRKSPMMTFPFLTRLNKSFPA